MLDELLLARRVVDTAQELLHLDEISQCHRLLPP
jgi:hypothetical protein